MRIKSLLGTALLTLATGIHVPSMAATGDMGTGIPNFGLYGTFNNSLIIIHSLINPTVNFPAGCPYLIISPATIGVAEHRMVYATLLTATAMQRRVRFFSHADRDGGCGVDYVSLVPQ